MKLISSSIIWSPNSCTQNKVKINMAIKLPQDPFSPKSRLGILSALSQNLYVPRYKGHPITIVSPTLGFHHWESRNISILSTTVFLPWYLKKQNLSKYMFINLFSFANKKVVKNFLAFKMQNSENEMIPSKNICCCTSQMMC